MPRLYGSFVPDLMKCTECGSSFPERCDTCSQKELRIARCMLAVAQRELKRGKKTHAQILKAIRDAAKQKEKVVGKEIEHEKKRRYFRIEVDEELGAHEREFYRVYGARAWRKRKKAVRKQIEQMIKEKNKSEMRSSKNPLEIG